MENMTSIDDEKKKEARAAYNAYRREWRRKNKDKDRAAQMRYWLKKAEQMKQADNDK